MKPLALTVTFIETLNHLVDFNNAIGGIDARNRGITDIRNALHAVKVNLNTRDGSYALNDLDDAIAFAKDSARKNYTKETSLQSSLLQANLNALTLNLEDLRSRIAREILDGSLV